jgi:hypothetical protein
VPPCQPRLRRLRATGDPDVTALALLHVTAKE